MKKPAQKQKKDLQLTEHDEETCVSKIKLSDPGSQRKAIFLNPEKQKYIKRRMDGGHQKNVISADWMLTKFEAGDIVLELKGCDVAKALEQVIATAGYAKGKEMLKGRIAALILCTQHPGISTKIQRLMNEFTKNYKGPVHIRNRSGEFIFENVLSFDGPERI